MSVNLDLAERLEKNPRRSYITGVAIFLKLLSNILDNPKEEKFRKFKKTNQRISSELMSLDGMEQLILDTGFELVNDEFVLLRGGLGVMSKLKNYRDFFQKRLDLVQQSPAQSSSTAVIQKVIKKSSPAAVRITTTKPFHERIRFPQIMQTSNNFLRQLEQLSDSVMQYEDPLLQQSALQLIPTEKLKEKAIENLRKLQKMIRSKEIIEDEPPLEDLILEELAAWFKNDFFRWINAMPCRSCENEGTDAVGTRNENGVRVEVSALRLCQRFANDSFTF